MGFGGQRHAPAALIPAERPGTNGTRDWVGPRVGLDGCGTSPLLHGILSPDRPAHQFTSRLFRTSYSLLSSITTNDSMFRLCS